MKLSTLFDDHCSIAWPSYYSLAAHTKEKGKRQIVSLFGNQHLPKSCLLPIELRPQGGEAPDWNLERDVVSWISKSSTLGSQLGMSQFNSVWFWSNFLQTRTRTGLQNDLVGWTRTELLLNQTKLWVQFTCSLVCGSIQFWALFGCSSHVKEHSIYYNL